MEITLKFNDASAELPEVGKKCLCMTTNNSFFISETYYPHNGRGVITNYNRCWKGSSKATDTITKWAYLPNWN